jgi:hypothetical protein
MAKKYVNFRVGGSPYKVTDDYSVWTNDLLGKIIASKTVIQPGKSTVGHRLSDSDVVYIIVNGRGMMEVIEYMNSMEGHGTDPSQGIEHQDSFSSLQATLFWFNQETSLKSSMNLSTIN